MKKVILLGAMALALSATMAGCGQVKVSNDGNNIIVGKDKKSTEKSSEKSTEKSQAAAQSKKLEKELKEKQTKEEQEQAKVTWTEKKDAHLTDAMRALGKKRKVTYTKYDGKNALKVANTRIYPDTFKKDKFYLNGKKISIGWSPQGGDTYSYKVLSIYNRDLGSGKHATYLFCLHDKKPVVLVDSAVKSGNITLTKSTDKDLNKNFTDVMNGDV
ncbi:DUF4767 domain-containing protein [Lactobacillus sp.]|uniref:DUF4767 domain-containing protein n=1 Tax=Lactobacillus sp. TaxID=1591 RepID=UPI0025C73897|nr:DUF4767 domain-containing protein [Lactobacillus sp.]